MIIKRGHQHILLPVPDVGNANCRWVVQTSTSEDLLRDRDSLAEPTYYVIDADGPAEGARLPADFDPIGLSWLFCASALIVILSGGALNNIDRFKRLIRERSFAGAIITVVLSKNECQAAWSKFALMESPLTADLLEIYTEDVEVGENVEDIFFYRQRHGKLAS